VPSCFKSILVAGTQNNWAEPVNEFCNIKLHANLSTLRHTGFQNCQRTWKKI